MKRNILKFSGAVLLLSLIVLLAKIFLPRTYHVPQLQKRQGTKYWNLATGSRIGYTLIPGKGARKPYPIIYLHGGPGGAIYDRQIKTFSSFAEDGYDVYLYDQVGCGQSNTLENIEDYTADRHKKDLEQIIEKTGAKKIILVGQSWGAMLATLYIADNPARVEKLIFTGPGPIIPVNYELADLVAPDSLHLRDPVFSNNEANQLSQNLRSRAMIFWATTFGYRLAPDKEANDFLVSRTEQTNKSMVCDTTKALKAEAGGGFYAQIMTVNSFSQVEDPRPKLKHCPVPLLILKGQCDNQRWGFLKEYTEFFPQHEVVIIPGAGHGITIEQPGLYLHTIRKFLNKEADLR